MKNRRENVGASATPIIRFYTHVTNELFLTL